MKYLINIARFLVGALFIFSGFIKANDALGFSYKLEEYFVLFGMDWLAAISLFLAMFICVLEIALGIALLLGIKPKQVTWLLLLMIIFFTWLTGYSAFTGKVTDCGCFGDAIPLTPFESFYKDLILLVLIGFLFLKKKHITSFLNEKNNNRILYAGILASAIFTYWCYQHLPMIDFRAYKIGNHIPTLMNDGIPDEFATTLIYKNKSTGELKEFNIKNIPTDGQWEWQETKNTITKEGKLPTVHDFEIADDEGNSLTEELLTNPDYSLMIIAYDLKTTDINGFKDLVVLANALESDKKQIFALTSSSYMDIENLRHDIGAPFPFYNTDATVLKTIIRSNPGLLLIKEGTILGKWHANDIPTYQELSQHYFK